MKKIIMNLIVSLFFYAAGLILGELTPYIVGYVPSAKEAAGSIPPGVIYEALLHVAWWALILTGGIILGRAVGLMFERSVKNDK
jgi:hypothetical protein